MIAFVFEFLVAAAAIAFVLRRRAWRRQRTRRGTRLADADIEAILEHGRVEMDEPLDLGEIRREEDKFWDEQRWE